MSRPQFGPCSVKQQLVLLENEVDILLTGGEEHCLQYKTNL